MWTCPKCSEPIEDQFASCRKCAVPPKEAGSKSFRLSPAWRYFFLGVLCELILMAFCLLLPGSWLQVEARNFVLITHFPLMLWLAGLGENAVTAILGLLIALMVMAVVWGLLIYLVIRLVKRALARRVVSRRQRLVFGCGAGF